MPLRFSRRLLLFIGPVIAILLASNLLSLRTSIRLAERVTELTDHQLPLVQRITVLTFNQHEQTLQLERALRLQPEDLVDGVGALRQSFARRADQVRNDLVEARRSIEQYEAGAGVHGRQEMAEVRALLENVELRHTELQRHIEGVLDLLEAGDLAEIRRRRASVEQAEDVLEHAVEASLLGVERTVAAHSERARLEERRAILVVGALLVLGVAAGSLIIVWGIRSLVAAKDRERRLSALAAVGEFSATVAHGLRNPLAGIRAAAQLASQEAAGGRSTTESLASIRSEADRLEQRIASLLELSRPFHPNRRRQDLRPLLESVRQTLAENAHQEGVEISLHLPSSPLMCRIDGDYLEDAVLELAANALHATPEGGTISLALSRVAGGARITVTDTGHGIPEPARGRIFDLFFSTREDGSGVGLAGVRKVVEAHSGQVRVLNTGTEGTEFAIDLP